ncbi:hypothetical protein [Parahaliea mediterranea]|uniref:hypothetical protein n=1 Tax=Parahaliea mediterranea TaxID=651086 RepID=UPI000E2F1342|nr:hypothetical protein [Parahaliea mediterranea]
MYTPPLPTIEADSSDPIDFSLSLWRRALAVADPIPSERHGEFLEAVLRQPFCDTEAACTELALNAKDQTAMAEWLQERPALRDLLEQEVHQRLADPARGVDKDAINRFLARGIQMAIGEEDVQLNSFFAKMGEHVQGQGRVTNLTALNNLLSTAAKVNGILRPDGGEGVAVNVQLDFGGENSGNGSPKHIGVSMVTRAKDGRLADVPGTPVREPKDITPENDVIEGEVVVTSPEDDPTAPPLAPDGEPLW